MIPEYKIKHQKLGLKKILWSLSTSDIRRKQMYLRKVRKKLMYSTPLKWMLPSTKPGNKNVNADDESEDEGGEGDDDEGDDDEGDDNEGNDNVGDDDVGDDDVGDDDESDDDDDDVGDDVGDDDDVDKKTRNKIKGRGTNLRKRNLKIQRRKSLNGDAFEMIIHALKEKSRAMKYVSSKHGPGFWL
jgi:hypothetical protein